MSSMNKLKVTKKKLEKQGNDDGPQER